jgi:hypothetical protein
MCKCTILQNLQEQAILACQNDEIDWLQASANRQQKKLLLKIVTII